MGVGGYETSLSPLEKCRLILFFLSALVGQNKTCHKQDYVEIMKHRTKALILLMIIKVASVLY